MQPALQARVVHVGLPAEHRECLTAADNTGEFGVGQLGGVDLSLIRVGPSQAHELGARDGVHVGDVAVQHAADLDPKRRGEQEAGEPGGAADGHLGSDPAAEAVTDEDGVLKRKLRCKIEI